MERSEPTLVPEWLKAASNGSAATHHSPASSSQDECAAPVAAKNRSSLNIVDGDSPAHLERSNSSSFFHRSSSSNGGVGHEKDNSSHSRSYSSFGRSHRDREWDKDIFSLREKDRSSVGNFRDHDYTDPDMFITSRINKDMFRRSQSMISAKRPEMRARRSVSDTNNHSNLNGAAGGNKVVSIHKATFERDFPSLGTEEKHGVDRVGSPGLSIPAQSLPMGTSAVIMGNGWTSALAEVPAITVSNSTGLSSTSQAAASSSGSLTPSTTTGLNMAETLAQAPLRTRAAPQLSLETQRLEELAIKQSRQLIPMTPSLQKNSITNSEKQKPKVSLRNELSMVNKVGVQPLSSSQPVSHLLRGVAVPKSDTTKTSNGGKLLVLKPARENGTSHAIKDGSNSNNAGRAASNQLAAVASSVASAPMGSQNNLKPAATERKAITPSLNKTLSMEKKPINSQAKSRNDFFNLMRKKTLTNNSSSAPDPEPAVSASVLEKSGELTSEVNVVSSQGSEVSPLEDFSLNADRGAVAASNGDASENSQRSQNIGEKHVSSDASPYPDEEEAAFLKSLGWEEDAGEEEGLTEEEINAFYQEYMKLKPSSKLCQGIREQKLPVQSGVNNLSGGSTSEAKTKA